MPGIFQELNGGMTQRSFSKYSETGIAFENLQGAFPILSGRLHVKIYFCQ